MAAGMATGWVVGPGGGAASRGREAAGAGVGAAAGVAPAGAQATRTAAIATRRTNRRRTSEGDMAPPEPREQHPRRTELAGSSGSSAARVRARAYHTAPGRATDGRARPAAGSDAHRIEDDLPEDVGLFEQPVGRRRLREREHAVDYRLDLAGGGRVERALHVFAVVAGAADDPVAAAVQLGDVDLNFAAAVRAGCHQPAA